MEAAFIRFGGGRCFHPDLMLRDDEPRACRIQSSLADWYSFARITQDYVLGYFQTSLRDFAKVECLPWNRGSGSMARKLLLGFAHLFRPTYALANVGHPSITGDLSLTWRFAGLAAQYGRWLAMMDDGPACLCLRQIRGGTVYWLM